MSLRSQRKHACRQHVEYSITEPLAADRVVARVLGTCGGNLVEVEEGAGGSRFLASLPTRLRRCVWLRRGHHVLLEPISEGRRVRAEVVLVLSQRHQQQLQQLGCWPARFAEATAAAAVTSEAAAGGEDEQGTVEAASTLQSLPCLSHYENTNRRAHLPAPSSTSSSCSSSLASSSDSESDDYSCCQNGRDNCSCVSCTISSCSSAAVADGGDASGGGGGWSANSQCSGAGSKRNISGVGGGGGGGSACDDQCSASPSDHSQLSRKLQQCSVSSADPRGWRKVLYRRQPFPDNYVGQLFLDGLRCNTAVVVYSTGEAVAGGAAVLQQAACVPLLFTAYERLVAHAVAPLPLLSAAVVAAVCAMVWCRAVSLDTSSRGAQWRVALVSAAVTSAMSPLLTTLTSAVSGETVHALTMTGLGLHLLVYSYGGPRSAAVSDAVALNAALFSALCLASRLPSPLHAMTLLALAALLFVLTPQLRRRWWRDWRLVALAWLQATVSLWLVAETPLLLLTILSLYVLMCPVAPLLFVWAQRYKHTICGPWDEAVLQPVDQISTRNVSEASRHRVRLRRKED